MTPSQRCVDLVKSFEGFFGHAYRCPAGVWTIGYGTTRGVKPGDYCTQDEAEQWLADELNEKAEGVSRLVTVDLNQNQFDALCSFAYNVGTGALQKSTLLRKLNAGDYQEAADQFPLWTKGGGKTLPGLVRRRAAERDLFLEA